MVKAQNMQDAVKVSQRKWVFSCILNSVYNIIYLLLFFLLRVAILNRPGKTFNFCVCVCVLVKDLKGEPCHIAACFVLTSCGRSELQQALRSI